nr:hypothetical protein [Gammaproteobacteria bacterium]
MHGKVVVGQCLGVMVAGLLSGAVWAAPVSPDSSVLPLAGVGADCAAWAVHPQVGSPPRGGS